ncbi:MAG: 4Fe-4S ferredoxin, partial [Acidobacteria bacterium]
MADIYKRLAKKLDRLPHGFPATKSGVDLRILRKIFSPEDAEFALKLKPLPETADHIAHRLHRPVELVQAILDQMASNGQIGSFKLKGKQQYALMPFVVGIYEFQLNRLDKELADLVEEYMPSLMKV